MKEVQESRIQLQQAPTYVSMNPVVLLITLVLQPQGRRKYENQRFSCSRHHPLFKNPVFVLLIEEERGTRVKDSIATETQQMSP